MGMSMVPEQAVLLAGGTGSRLRPLNSTGTPKALLPVGNEPLISFPLRSLEEAGVTFVFVICFGETSATKVQAWITNTYQGKLTLLVKSIPADSTGSKTADALRVVGDKLSGDNILVISGDLVTDFNLKVLMLAHMQRSAICTSLLTRRATSAAAETGRGKAPTNVDYVGLSDENQVQFFHTVADTAKPSLKVPMDTLLRCGRVDVTTNYVDQHCYIFDRRTVTEVLESKPTIKSIKEDLLPYLVDHQRREQSTATADLSSLTLIPEISSAESQTSQSSEKGLEPDHWWVGALVAPEKFYCKRTNTLTSFGDVNRDVTSSTDLAAKFLNQKVNSEGYFRHETATVLPKTMVGAGCMLGHGTRVGEKSTLKRSVLGQHNSIGNHVKLVNSVLLNDVTIEDNCTIQNCILCSGSHIQAHAQLRDCQVGPSCTVPGGQEHRGELFDKNKPPTPR